MEESYLIYIDMFFPNKAKGETFLASELENTNTINAKRIIFPVWATGKDDVTLDDISVTHLSTPYTKTKKAGAMARNIFSADFRKELNILKETKRSNVQNSFTALSFIADGSYFSNYLVSYIKENIPQGSRVILYSYWMHWCAYAAVQAKKVLKDNYNISSFSRAHRFDVYEYAAKGQYIPCRQTIIDGMDYILPISEDAFDYIQSNYSADNKLRLSRLGTFDKGVNISPRSRALKILSCSWMRKVKRIDLICDALKYVDFDVEWTHIGSGEEEEHIRQLADGIQNSHVKYYFTGALSNDKVLDYYRNSDVNVFINVSASEGVPVSVMEAMSFGKIAIATDVGGTKEVIKDSITGFLMPKDFEISQLAAILKRLSEMKESEYRNMSINARQYWEERCNAEKNYAEFKELINEMLRGGYCKTSKQFCRHPYSKETVFICKPALHGLCA